MSRPTCLDDLARLDVQALVKGGYLRDGQRRWMGWRIDDEMAASLLITAAGDSIDILGTGMNGRTISTVVELIAVPLHFGDRLYLSCPRCDRACSYLYFDDLECSTCTGLPHLSQALTGMSRKQDRLQRARLALNMDQHGQAHRPRGVRADRWMRLWAEHEAALQAIEASLAA